MVQLLRKREKNLTERKKKEACKLTGYYSHGGKSVRISLSILFKVTGLGAETVQKRREI